MKRPIWAWLGLGVVALGVSGLAWFWFSGGSGEPSTELTTPTIAGHTTTTPIPGESTTTATGADGVAYVIKSDQSEASFTIDEVLQGEPNTVVGTTSEVAGQFILVLDDLAATEFSDFVINARTFETGSSTRDRAIRGPIILDSASDEFEFITFTVTETQGLEGAASVGDTITFVLIGDLTIRGETSRVEFAVTATLTAETAVDGRATTEVRRTDFGIGIPNVPSVADVTDEVQIAVDFVATSA